MADSFGWGKTTDIFGLAGATLVWQSSKSTPRAKQVADAKDESGNIVAQTAYGTTSIEDAEVAYVLKSGTLDLSTLAVGFVEDESDMPAGRVITGIDIKTSNGAWPVLTVKGVVGAIGIDGETTFSLPDITISGLKKAQLLDFTVGADCRLTGSGLAVNCELAEAIDADGNVCAMSISGCNAEVTAELVEITAAGTWTPAVGWTETQAPGADKSNTGYGTTNAKAVKFLPKDVVA